MVVSKYKKHQKPLSAVASTLSSVYRPDPVVPEAMMAILRALDGPPRFVADHVPSDRQRFALQAS